jgi:hypothetical protein
VWALVLLVGITSCRYGFEMEERLADAPDGFQFVGGTVTGLAGSALVLQNNGSDDLLRSANGPFMFMTPIEEGKPYLVTVLSAPTGQQVTISNASGIVGNSPTLGVVVACTAIGVGDAGIRCGGGYCASPDRCCHAETGANGFCRATSTSCGASYISMPCSDSFDCGGQSNICCASLDPGGQLVAVSCQPSTATCVPINMNSSIRYLCDPAASTPCPGQMTCVSEPERGWYRCE